MRATGFTLLEVLMVLAMVAALSALAMARILPDEAELLRRDCARLARALDRAGEQAIALGQSVAWRAGGAGYRFEAQDDSGSWRALAEAGLPAGRWSQPGEAPTVWVDGEPLTDDEPLVFSAVGDNPSFRVRLTRFGHTGWVEGNGARASTWSLAPS